jgi:hypothetical protein
VDVVVVLPDQLGKRGRRAADRMVAAAGPRSPARPDVQEPVERLLQLDEVCARAHLGVAVFGDHSGRVEGEPNSEPRVVLGRR